METFDDEPKRDRRPDRVDVNVSEYVTTTGGETLIAYGIGSCVAIIMYDPRTGVGGMANAVLPDREAGIDGTAGKFVDSAATTLLKELVGKDAGYGDIEGYLAGGSRMIDFEDLGADVGTNNVAAARRKLRELDVGIEAADVGGGYGRTVEFDTATGEILVRTAEQGARQLRKPGR